MFRDCTILSNNFIPEKLVYNIKFQTANISNSSFILSFAPRTNASMLACEWKSQTLLILFLFFAGSLCALPADNGPCLSEIQDALSPAKQTSITQACSNYLTDLQTSCSIRKTSSNFDECTNICGKLKC